MLIRIIFSSFSISLYVLLHTYSIFPSLSLSLSLRFVCGCVCAYMCTNVSVFGCFSTCIILPLRQTSSDRKFLFVGPSHLSIHAHTQYTPQCTDNNNNQSSTWDFWLTSIFFAHISTHALCVLVGKFFFYHPQRIQQTPDPRGLEVRGNGHRQTTVVLIFYCDYSGYDCNPTRRTTYIRICRSRQSY